MCPCRNTTATRIDNANEKLPSEILADIEKYKTFETGEHETNKSDDVEELYKRKSDSTVGQLSLKSLFEGDLTTFENVIEVSNVPLKTRKKR